MLRDVINYVEPFFGSGAVLLGRPHPANTETVNDLDWRMVVKHFWRALQHDSGMQSSIWHADSPVNEADQSCTTPMACFTGRVSREYEG